MRFTIITATKNNKAGLLRAIECVRNQTYENVEHIIVDGGSTDGSVELLRKVQSSGNQKLVNSKEANETTLPTSYYSLHTIIEPDNGIYDAINKGIKLATGDVIGLLHSDDLYSDENVIAKYAEVFKGPFDFAQGDGMVVDAVYSDLVYIKTVNSKQKSVDSEKILRQAQDDNKGSSLITTYYPLLTNYSTVRYWKTQQKEFITEQHRHKELKKGWMPPHPTLFIRKEVFEKYGLYRTDMKIAADYEMILRLLYKHKITSYYLPFTTYYMEMGGASNKSMKNILQKSKEDLRALKVNGINFPILTLISKNFRKLHQFLARDLSGV